MAGSGVDITVGGVLHPSNYPYSVVEDSTPTDPSDISGGVGQFTFAIDEGDARTTRQMRDKTVVLSDGGQGTTTGTARGLGGIDGTVTVTADARLAALNVIRTAQPYIGTLGGAFTYYLGLAGVTSGISVDSAVTGTAVVFPGWNGNIWDQVRKMAVAQQVEVSLVSNNAVLRPLRARIAQNYRDSSVSWGLDGTNLARSIEVYYYQNVQRTNVLAYPDGGWTTGNPIQNAIAAGATATFTYPLKSSLSSVQQPVAVDFVPPTGTSTSVYTVVGRDGLPYLASQWVAEGGKISAAIGLDTKSLIVTVTASTNTQYGPFTIAMSSGTSNSYSSLRIMGSGVFTNKQKVTLLTGVDPLKVTTLVGATVDNEMVSTLEQATHIGLWTLKRYGTARYTINVTTSGVNRVGDTGSYAQPALAALDAQYAGMTIAQFNTLWAGKTFQQFNDAWIATVASTYANQAFGNVAGARLRFGDSMFRIRSATITPSGITYSAEEDTTMADIDAIWSGATMSDFDAQWAGKTLADFATAPLWRTPPNLGAPYPDLYYPDTIYPY